MKKDEDKKSIDRSEDLKKQISKLEGEYKKENEQWINEKNNIIDMQKLKSEIDSEKNKLNILQREGKLSEAGELAYGKIPLLEKQLSDLDEQKTKNNMFSKSVTSSEIASVISKTTGIPLIEC